MDTKVIPLLLHYNANILATTNINNTALMEVLHQDDTTCDNHMLLAKINPPASDCVIL